MAGANANSTNRFGPSDFIVGPTLGAGCNYTSIQAAINDAPIRSCIYIRGGIYAGNVTLKNGVSLYGVPTAGPFGTFVQINGNVTLDAALSALTVTRIENLTISGAGAVPFTTINANNVRLQINNCVISGPIGFNGIELNNTSAVASTLTIRNSQITGDIALQVNQNQTVNVYDSNLTGNVTAAVEVNGTSLVFLDDCRLTSAGTAAVINNSTAVQAAYCTIIGNSCLGFQINAGTAFVYDCNVDSSDASGFWVSGVGNLNYADVINIQNIAIDPNLNIVAYDWKPYAEQGTAPGTGVVKGTSCFDEAVFSVVDGFVSSIGGGGFVESITADGSTATPTAGNISFAGQSGVNFGFSSPSTILVRAPLYTQTNASGLMVENTVYFTTGTITKSLPSAIQDGLVNGVVSTDLNPVTVTPFNGTSAMRVGTQLSSAGGTAVSTARGDVLILRYNTADDVWYATNIVGTWLVS